MPQRNTERNPRQYPQRASRSYTRKQSGSVNYGIGPKYKLWSKVRHRFSLGIQGFQGNDATAAYTDAVGLRRALLGELPANASTERVRRGGGDVPREHQSRSVRCDFLFRARIENTKASAMDKRCPTRCIAMADAAS